LQGYGFFVGGPDGQHGIACKFKDISAVSGDDVDELPEEDIEQTAELFTAAFAVLGEAFGEGRKAGDVGQHDGGGETFEGGGGEGGRVGGQPTTDEEGDVTTERFQQGGHGGSIHLLGNC
jgi:hypothetical protein